MTPHRPALLLMLSLLAITPGCGPRESRDVAGAQVEFNPPKTEEFLTKVNAVKPGTPRAAVREALGEPDQIVRDFVDALPEPGPAEELADLTAPGTQYEQWTYKRGDSHYHVFFTRGVRGGDADWEVLTVRSMPKEAVY